MSWEDLLNSGSERVLPWYGFKRVHDSERSWVLLGPKPPEHGWYRFSTTGRRHAQLVSEEQQPVDADWMVGNPKVSGYLVGDRLIPDLVWVDPDPARLIEQTERVYCPEMGLEMFTRVLAARDREDRLVYIQEEFPLGPEQEVIEAYQDRAESIDNIGGVTPALDLAFRWVSYQRQRHEERQRELQRLREEEDRKRAEEARIQRLMRDAGTAIGRRALAAQDFETAAREALRVSGAELLGVRQARNRREMVVQYRFRRQRLECVVDKTTMGVVDAGVCLTDHDTGKKYDTYFTLESLPGVIGEAMDTNRLVVWRHA